MLGSSLTRNKINMIKLPPLKLNFSNLCKTKHKTKQKSTSHTNKMHSISSHNINFSNPISYKSHKIYNFRLKGMFSFSDKEKMEFKSKAEKYVESLLNDDNNSFSNDNKIQNTEQGMNINKDNYQKLIDPLEIIKEKYFVTHYTERLSGNANLKKKKDFNEIINNFSINSSIYRQVAPHSVVPKKDVLKHMKIEMKNHQNNLKPFSFGNVKKIYKERKKILNSDNSNYDETMFYLGQIFKPDFEHRIRGTVKMANNFLHEMNKRQEETNKQKDMINQVG